MLDWGIRHARRPTAIDCVIGESSEKQARFRGKLSELEHGEKIIGGSSSGHKRRGSVVRGVESCPETGICL